MISSNRARIIGYPAIKNDCRAIRDASAARTIWIADAHRGDGKRFVVRADDKFAELEAEICAGKRGAGNRISGEAVQKPY